MQGQMERPRPMAMGQGQRVANGTNRLIQDLMRDVEIAQQQQESNKREAAVLETKVKHLQKDRLYETERVSLLMRDRGAILASNERLDAVDASLSDADNLLSVVFVKEADSMNGDDAAHKSVEAIKQIADEVTTNCDEGQRALLMALNRLKAQNAAGQQRLDVLSAELREVEASADQLSAERRARADELAGLNIQLQQLTVNAKDTETKYEQTVLTAEATAAAKASASTRRATASSALSKARQDRAAATAAGRVQAAAEAAAITAAEAELDAQLVELKAAQSEAAAAEREAQEAAVLEQLAGQNADTARAAREAAQAALDKARQEVAAAREDEARNAVLLQEAQSIEGQVKALKDRAVSVRADVAGLKGHTDTTVKEVKELAGRAATAEQNAAICDALVSVYRTAAMAVCTSALGVAVEPVTGPAAQAGKLAKDFEEVKAQLPGDPAADQASEALSKLTDTAKQWSDGADAFRAAAVSAAQAITTGGDGQPVRVLADVLRPDLYLADGTAQVLPGSPHGQVACEKLLCERAKAVHKELENDIVGPAVNQNNLPQINDLAEKAQKAKKNAQEEAVKLAEAEAARKQAEDALAAAANARKQAEAKIQHKLEQMEKGARIQWTRDGATCNAEVSSVFTAKRALDTQAEAALVEAQRLKDELQHAAEQAQARAKQQQEEASAKAEAADRDRKREAQVQAQAQAAAKAKADAAAAQAAPQPKAGTKRPAAPAEDHDDDEDEDDAQEENDQEEDQEEDQDVEDDIFTEKLKSSALAKSAVKPVAQAKPAQSAAKPVAEAARPTPAPVGLGGNKKAAVASKPASAASSSGKAVVEAPVPAPAARQGGGKGKGQAVVDNSDAASVASEASMFSNISAIGGVKGGAGAGASKAQGSILPKPTGPIPGAAAMSSVTSDASSVFGDVGLGFGYGSSAHGLGRGQAAKGAGASAKGSAGLGKAQGSKASAKDVRGSSGVDMEDLLGDSQDHVSASQVATQAYGQPRRGGSTAAGAGQRRSVTFAGAPGVDMGDDHDDDDNEDEEDHSRDHGQGRGHNSTRGYGMGLEDDEDEDENMAAPTQAIGVNSQGVVLGYGGTNMGARASLGGKPAILPQQQAPKPSAPAAKAVTVTGLGGRPSFGSSSGAGAGATSTHGAGMYKTTGLSGGLGSGGRGVGAGLASKSPAAGMFGQAAGLGSGMGSGSKPALPPAVKPIPNHAMAPPPLPVNNGARPSPPVQRPGAGPAPGLGSAAAAPRPAAAGLGLGSAGQVRRPSIGQGLTSGSKASASSGAKSMNLFMDL